MGDDYIVHMEVIDIHFIKENIKRLMKSQDKTEAEMVSVCLILGMMLVDLNKVGIKSIRVDDVIPEALQLYEKRGILQ